MFSSPFVSEEMLLATYGTRSGGSAEPVPGFKTRNRRILEGPALTCLWIFGSLRFDCFNVVEVFEVQQIIIVLGIIVIIRVYWSKGVIQFFVGFLLLERIVEFIVRFIRVSGILRFRLLYCRFFFFRFKLCLSCFKGFYRQLFILAQRPHFAHDWHMIGKRTH